MLRSEEIRCLLHQLAKELAARGVVGEVLLCGGAVMCLVYNARDATKDVDAVFEPTAAIREAAAIVAARAGLPPDWLNDAVKGFLTGTPPRDPVLELPNLRVYAPAPDYMLAMKCVSARYDSLDRADIQFLIRHMDLHSVGEVADIICRYYPRSAVPARTLFLVEELMAADGGADALGGAP